MSPISLIAGLSILCANIQPDSLGTNGAGEVRAWTALDGRWTSGSINAAFFSVGGGDVTLSFTRRLDLRWPASPQTPNRILQISDNVTQRVCVPLGKLSASDRRWIEERNPAETCLDAKSRRGTVGTLTPRDGWYQVVKITGDRALIEYVRNEKDKPAWTFWLHSNFVSSLEVSKQYTTISMAVVKDYAQMPKIVQERYGIDFRIVQKQSSNGKGIDRVEDYR